MFAKARNRTVRWPVPAILGCIQEKVPSLKALPIQTVDGSEHVA